MSSGFATAFRAELAENEEKSDRRRKKVTNRVNPSNKMCGKRLRMIVLWERSEEVKKGLHSRGAKVRGGFDDRLDMRREMRGERERERVTERHNERGSEKRRKGEEKEDTPHLKTKALSQFITNGFDGRLVLQDLLLCLVM